MRQVIACVVWSAEFTSKMRDEAYELTKMAEEFFIDKNYCPEVERCNIFWQSTPPKWMFMYKQHRPAYVADKIVKMEGMYNMRLYKLLDIHVQVPYSEYSAQDTKIGRWNVIGKAILAYLREMKYPVVLRKKFDRDRFNADMEAFFRSLGCSLE
ncbi:MAG: hypothetical protein NC127_07935 [Muribaculum sp.]|nr:hypothetical protein [Muribaculum sp.]